MSKVFTICFEGGPACGKTASLNYLKEHTLPNDNWKVCFVREIAQAFFLDEPKSIIDALDNKAFLSQYFIYRTEVFAEQIFRDYAGQNDQNCLLIFDRGITDAEVYLSKEDLDKICSQKEIEAFKNHYDHVLFFMGDKQNFLIDQDTARKENNYEQVLQLCNRSYEIWHKNENITDIPQKDDVEDKFHNVRDVINSLIGENLFS